METPAIYNKETPVQADDETGLYKALTVLLLQFASHFCLCRNTHFIYKCRGGPTEQHSPNIRPVTVNRLLSRSVTDRFSTELCSGDASCFL
jgi:hypothetical protein